MNALNAFPPLKLYAKLEQGLNAPHILKDLWSLSVRLYMAKFFLSSGLTKLASIPAAIALFRDEYKLPLLPPEIATYMALGAELGLPVLLILGLLTRVAGLGLVIMTLVIATLVYPGVAENEYNLLLCSSLIIFGSGRFGLDALLFKTKA